MHIILEILVLLGRLTYFYIEAVFRLVVPPGRKSVRGQVVVITGAAGGIGRSLAFKFSSLGAKVAVWDINKVSVNIIPQADSHQQFTNVLVI